MKGKLEVSAVMVFANAADKRRSALCRPPQNLMDAGKSRYNCPILSFGSQGKDKAEAPEKVLVLVPTCCVAHTPNAIAL